LSHSQESSRSACGASRSEENSAPGIGTPEWLCQFETTNDNARKADQRIFDRGNRRAWIGRRRNGSWYCREAWAGDTVTLQGGDAKTLTDAMSRAADWLRDAAVSP